MADQDARIDLGIRGLGPAEHIGRGGFADVYRAEQLSLRRTVAVKVLRAQASDAETEARFERECHAIGAVSDHPHIVGVHEGGFTRNGRAYLVMEYLPGGSLSERIAESGPLPGQEAVDITIKIGRALAEAHRAGILHRDLKPANIMISAYGEPALGDFGIARIEGGHRTATGVVTASFAHAAPEVLEGHPPTQAADIYALGSTLYELLVGHGPYYDARDDSVWPLMKRILSEPMPAAATAGMGSVLGYAFSRATARDPQDRYQDVEEFVADLSAAAANPPVTMDPADRPGFDQGPAGPGIEAFPGLGGQAMAGESMPRSGRQSEGAGSSEPNQAAAGFGGPMNPTTPVAPIGIEPPPAAATPDLLLPASDQPDGQAETPPPWSELYEPLDATPSGFSADLSPPPAVPSAAPPPAVAPPGEPSLEIPPPGMPSPATSSPFGQPSPAPLQDMPPPAMAPPALPEPAELSPAGPSSGGTDGGLGLDVPVVGSGSTPNSTATMLGMTVAVLGGLGLLIVAGVWLYSNLGSDQDELIAAIDGDLDGPLPSGSQVQLMVAEAPAGATFRVVVDGLATGTSSPQIDPLTLEPGRHALAVEVTTDDQTQVTPPIGVYAADEPPPAGYRANLASVSIDGDGWSKTLEVFDGLVADGHAGLQILESNEAAGQAPGYWNLFVPGFGEDPAAAESYCRDFDLAIPSQCFAGYFDPNP